MADAAPATPATPATPAKRGRKPKVGAKPKSDRPPTMELVIEAIQTEKDPKGTSVAAIKKYILANHKVKSAQFLSHMLRRAFEHGLQDGHLTRPKKQTETRLLMGRYCLAGEEKAPKAAAKPKSKKSPAKKAAAKPKVKTPKKRGRPAGAAKAKSPKKGKKSPKKPAAKKAAKKA